MTLRAAAAAATLLALASRAAAFQAPAAQRGALAPARRAPAPLAMSSEPESEVDRLRAQAAKYRAQSDALSKEMGKAAPSGAPAAPAAPVSKNLSVAEARAAAGGIAFEAGDAAAQVAALDGLVDTGDFSLWNSAVRRGPTAAATAGMSSKLVPFAVTLNTLESRTDGKVTGESLGVGGDSEVKFEDFQDLTIAVVLGSTALGILSLAVLPENTGATFTYLFALVPILFIAIGSTSPGIIAAAIVSTRGDREDAEVQRERICRHEAGHFLCGYVCGLPVKSYRTSDDTGVPCVEFHTSADAGGDFSDAAIAALSVVAMSGSVAEIMAYGKAKGGEQDLMELQACFRKSKDFIGAAKQQDLTRWGALSSYGLIKANLPKYEGLVQAFKDKKSLAECVSIIEGA